MDISKLFLIVEKFRRQAVGDPIWVKDRMTYEYESKTLKLAIVLKIMRAAQGIKSLYLLCEQGLFIDMGAIYRCVNDCSSEVYFMLEEYPNSSQHVDQFVESFYGKTSEYIPTQKIHSALVRVLSGLEKDDETRARISNIYKTFSGYIHAHYAHVMQIYGGPVPDCNFKLEGVPSIEQRAMHREFVKQAYFSTLHSMGYAAHKFGLNDIYYEIVQIVEVEEESRRV